MTSTRKYMPGGIIGAQMLYRWCGRWCQWCASGVGGVGGVGGGKWRGQVMAADVHLARTNTPYPPYIPL